jgi:polyisoprenoid-binding protein YceI
VTQSDLERPARPGLPGTAGGRGGPPPNGVGGPGGPGGGGGGRRSYPLKWVVVGLGLVALLLIGGPYFFFNVIEGHAPAKLQLPPAIGTASGTLTPGPVTGTWTVGAGSLAGYRVDEILFGQTHTAVGRTSKVTGGIVISGTEVTAAAFTVDMASVKSDQGSRDAQFDGFIMRTFDHPHATFRLTQPIQLGRVPQDGQTISATAVGDLDLRGVTRSVTFTVQAERLAAAIDIQAEIPITYSLWHIPNPSFAVARLGRTGTIEVLLHLVPAPASKG